MALPSEKKTAKPIQHPEYQKSPMDRRVFIRRVVTAAGLGAAASYIAWAPEDWPLSRKDKSGLKSVPHERPYTLDNRRYWVQGPATAADIGIGRRGSDPDYALITDETQKVELAQRMLKKALDAIGGLERYIKKDDIVLVKPNVAFDRSPALGATSNPYILEALLRMLIQDCRAQEVRVADNPIESPADCFRKSGVEKAVVKGGGRVYLPDANAFKMLHTPEAKLIENWWFFHRPFTNVDKVIGIAPIKDHNLCQASMGLKNWYGLLGGTRNQFHQNIHEIISDFVLMIKPTLTILDGTNILMQNGPTGGDPSNVKRGDVVIASRDPIASDAWAYEHLLERGKDYPRYLHLAEEKFKRAMELSPADAGARPWRMDYTGRVKEIA